ncbi:MAG: formate/nitrite transporter family protein [Terrisporobacter sp.]|uniref:formate/nitrite transporter family protein n=1 Tax=Terrisporobacter sp. TaxID=1965305 RepID=UPI002FC77736
MNEETIELLAHKAEDKVASLKESKLKYLVLSIFAGMFIGLGCILIFTIGGQLYATHSPATKIVVGMSFSFALSAIIILGYELFTSNTMVMTVGALAKRASGKNAVRICSYSYFGNFLGAILVAGLFIGTGFGDSGNTIDYFIYSGGYKVAAPALQLFCRGVLANILVCAAVLAAYKTKDEMAKIAIVFLLIFAFVTSGFEHCIANMTTLLVCLFTPVANTVTIGNALYSTLFVTLGNIVGGAVFYGLFTYFMSKSKAKKEENKINKAS